MVRRKPLSQTWRTFLDNHLKSMASVDFFAVPTVLLVLAHERGRIVHFAVTAHPTFGVECSNNCAKPFPGMPHRDICCAIAIESSVRTSPTR